MINCYFPVFSKIGVVGWLLVFCLQASSAEPLSPDEKATVLAEIEAMNKISDARKVDVDVMQELTPELIRRLYESPELASLSNSQRLNGIPLAGRGSGLLTFERPSDIVRKMTSWFPEDMESVRADKKGNLKYIHGHQLLWGPFANWDPESIAFASLWKCMPQSAWIRPAENPFQRRSDVSGLQIYAISGETSDPENANFKFCLQNRAAYYPAWEEKDESAYARAAKIGPRAAPILRDKFAAYLRKYQCQGTGPDDCVMVLLLWASLLPNDPELAATMQVLEPLIGPDSPLPEMRRPFAFGDSIPSDGEARFDAVLRRAAYLRAKLLSTQATPNEWPIGAFANTLKQLSAVQRANDEPFTHRWYFYKISERNEPVNPWRALPKGEMMIDPWRSDVLGEMESLDMQGDCETFQHWATYTDKALHTDFVLQRLRGRQSVKCASVDFEWLRHPERSRYLYQYLALLGELPGGEQDKLLTGLTAGGESCFGKRSGQANWLRQLCRNWISEPQTVRKYLKHTHLSLSKNERFSARELSSLRDDSQQGMIDWLSHLVPGREDELRHIATTFVKADAHAYAATEWRHPVSDHRLIELALSQDNTSSWPFGGSRTLLAVTPKEILIVGIPSRFSYQYDDGSIATVTDLDRDGKLEVWFSGSFGECDGEGSQPGVDCDIQTTHFGEINDDSVSYFAYTPPAKKTDRRNNASRTLQRT